MIDPVTPDKAPHRRLQVSQNRVLYKSQRNTTMLHKLPNGNMLYLSGNLTPYQAQKRTEDYKRWEQEHREELEVSSQQLFDDMFGG